MAIGALLAIFAMAGCGTDEEPETDAAAASPGAATSSAAASPSPEASAAPTTDAPEADDADVVSCDGECEVPFSGSIQFPLEGDDGEWTVDAAVEDGGGVDVDLTDPDGMGGGGGLLYEPGCTLEIRADGGGGLSCAAAGTEPPAPEAGGFVAHLVALDGDDATLHVALG